MDTLLPPEDAAKIMAVEKCWNYIFEPVGDNEPAIDDEWTTPLLAAALSPDVSEGAAHQALDNFVKFGLMSLREGQRPFKYTIIALPTVRGYIAARNQYNRYERIREEIRADQRERGVAGTVPAVLADQIQTFTRFAVAAMPQPKPSLRFVPSKDLTAELNRRLAELP